MLQWSLNVHWVCLDAVGRDRTHRSLVDVLLFLLTSQSPPHLLLHTHTHVHTYFHTYVITDGKGAKSICLTPWVKRSLGEGWSSGSIWPTYEISCGGSLFQLCTEMASPWISQQPLSILKYLPLAKKLAVTACQCWINGSLLDVRSHSGEAVWLIAPILTEIFTFRAAGLTTIWLEGTMAFFLPQSSQSQRSSTANRYRKTAHSLLGFPAGRGLL